MATIVGIHGIGQQFGGGYQIGRAWYDAVRDGLTAAGFQRKARALTPDDMRVGFFGDLFRSPGAMAAQNAPFSPADIAPGLERELLAALYCAAVEQDPSLGPPAGAMGPGMAAVQVMLDRLLRSATFAGVAQRAFIGNLKQVSQFLADRPVKDRILDRVHEEAASGSRVLIGHSLGSVVAYEYLCRYRPASVELLVTVGSPLGIPRLVFDRLTPAPCDGAGAWPGTVARWCNVADANDIVALRKRLAGLFPGPLPSKGVDDRMVDNGDQPHAAERYLNARETGIVLGEVLD